VQRYGGDGGDGILIVSYVTGTAHYQDVAGIVSTIVGSLSYSGHWQALMLGQMMRITGDLKITVLQWIALRAPGRILSTSAKEKTLHLRSEGRTFGTHQ
jgi:hypothetical protein